MHLSCSCRARIFEFFRKVEKNNSTRVLLLLYYYCTTTVRGLIVGSPTGSIDNNYSLSIYPVGLPTINPRTVIYRIGHWPRPVCPLVETGETGIEACSEEIHQDQE